MRLETIIKAVGRNECVGKNVIKAGPTDE